MRKSPSDIRELFSVINFDPRNAASILHGESRRLARCYFQLPPDRTEHYIGFRRRFCYHLQIRTQQEIELAWEAILFDEETREIISANFSRDHLYQTLVLLRRKYPASAEQARRVALVGEVEVKIPLLFSAERRIYTKDLKNFDTLLKAYNTAVASLKPGDPLSNLKIAKMVATDAAYETAIERWSRCRLRQKSYLDDWIAKQYGRHTKRLKMLYDKHVSNVQKDSAKTLIARSKELKRAKLAYKTTLVDLGRKKREFAEMRLKKRRLGKPKKQWK